MEELKDLQGVSPLRYSVRVERLSHRGKNCLALYFPAHYKLNRLVRTIPGATFSWTHTCWYIEERENLIPEIFLAFKRNAWVDINALRNKSQQSISKQPDTKVAEQLTEDHRQALRMMEQKLKLLGYSENTRVIYLQMFKTFLQFYALHDPIDLTEIEIRNYLLYMVEHKRSGRSYHKQCINAIKFFYEKVLGQERKEMEKMGQALPVRT